MLLRWIVIGQVHGLLELWSKMPQKCQFDLLFRFTVLPLITTGAEN